MASLRILELAKGRCDGPFEPVRAAFVDLLASGEESGAAVAVVADGRLVVDLWGGYADEARAWRWQLDTTARLGFLQFGETFGVPDWVLSEFELARSAHLWLATARGLARFYGALSGRDALLSQAEIARCSRDFQLKLPHTSRYAFSLTRPGGSLAFCDPDAGFGFAYFTNRTDATLTSNPGALRLVQALYDGYPASDGLESSRLGCRSGPAKKYA